MAVDDLFDGKSPSDRPDPIPRLRLWLGVAGVLVALGPFCCTSPFGGAAAILVWMRAGDEEARAAQGVGGPGVASAARRIRNLAFGLMSASITLLCLQSLAWPWIEGMVIDLVSWLASAAA